MKRKTRDVRTPAEASRLWRVFCAIEIPEAVGRSIYRYINELQTRFPYVEASWNRQQNFHLTLKFVGNISPDRVNDLSSAAAAASKSNAPFSIRVAGTGSFPGHGPPRVLWIGVNDQTQQLQRLQQRLEEECAHVGFEREERSLHPHVTVARLRKTNGSRELVRTHLEMGFQPLEVSIKELVVFRSQLGPNGSNYSVVSNHHLGNCFGPGGDG